MKDELWTTSQVSDAVLFAWEETDEDCTQRELVDAVVHNLRDNSDIKKFPPAGVVIEVSDNDVDWYTRVSVGDGDYCDLSNNIDRIDNWQHWRFAEAYWELSSKSDIAWMVLSDGSCLFTSILDLEIGDEYRGVTIVHVENRPEDV